MSEQVHRWALLDADLAIGWCRARSTMEIRCIFDLLGEDVKTKEDVDRYVEKYTTFIEKTKSIDLDFAFALKFSTLGQLIDLDICRENVMQIFKAASEAKVKLEVDMEGTPLVDKTLNLVYELAEKRYALSLALQAYLDRTEVDIESLIDHGITVRLVKGAYSGDITDFVKIQNKFKDLVKKLTTAGVKFTVGTHDPELVDWVKEKVADNKENIEFGFLMGLADNTKLQLVREGWAVAEYVPFGEENRAYVMRRKRYLQVLRALGRMPLF